MGLEGTAPGPGQAEPGQEVNPRKGTPQSPLIRLCDTLASSQLGKPSIMSFSCMNRNRFARVLGPFLPC